MNFYDDDTLIDDTVQKLVGGDKIGYIDDGGASGYMTLKDLLIREVEDGNDGFDQFMAAWCAQKDGESEYWAERIALSWVKDFLPEIKRDLRDEAAEDNALKRIDEAD